MMLAVCSAIPGRYSYVVLSVKLYKAAVMSPSRPRRYTRMARVRNGLTGSFAAAAVVFFALVRGAVADAGPSARRFVEVAPVEPGDPPSDTHRAAPRQSAAMPLSELHPKMAVTCPFVACP